MMRHARCIAVWGLVAMASCKSAPPESTSAGKQPASKPAAEKTNLGQAPQKHTDDSHNQPADKRERAFLVRLAPGPVQPEHGQSQPDQTVWLSVGPGGPKVVARADGAFAASHDHLWQWQSTKIDYTKTSCDCIHEAQQGDELPSDELFDRCSQPSALTSVILKNLTTGSALELPGLDIFLPATDLEELSTTTTDHGSFGSKWFATECVRAVSCMTPHPMLRCGSVVADLDTAEIKYFAAIVSDEKQAAIAKSHHRQAVNAVRRKQEAKPGGGCFRDPEDVHLDGGWPVIDGDHIEMNYVFYSLVAHVCPADWQDHAVAVNIPGGAPDGPLTCIVDIPAPVVAYATSRQDAKLIGWSRLPADRARRAQLRKTFVAASKSTGSAHSGDNND